ncbi:uncharacterized protein LOC127119467 [Lathyrus oleraceus]|uniref:Actin cross-linking n=1 Tax=Pisum sativum TaxID=3888 RepID=A0A9D4YE74_PEA|nr:uncharacterized protein LOC127119467 [Pisum sativum]KAI5437337.1 hypothetical protein KIW84_023449 [Pisum sativum]
MEFFNKSKVIKLRSHLDKYLIVDDDKISKIKIRQSRNGTVRRAEWTVEEVENRRHVIRLKSYNGKYLTATEIPFRLGVTGKTVILTELDEGLVDGRNEWEPIRDGFQIKLRSWCGKYLKGNGGAPPWRNSVTTDDFFGSVKQDCVLWDVEAVMEENMNEIVFERLLSSFASDDVSFSSDTESPMSVFSLSSPPATENFQTTKPNKLRTGMDFFHRAKAVRLKSHHDKYLLAEEDEESVTQHRNGSSKNAKWTVEYVPDYDNVIRLKSCYGKYLTASDQPFLLGMTGRKVLQTLPNTIDSSVEWEPVRDGVRVKLKTRYGNFLRGNGGLPPWRNTVTHDIPHRTVTQDWILWDVDVVEINVSKHGSDPAFENNNTPSPAVVVPTVSASFSRQQSNELSVGVSPKTKEGRVIYYHVAEDDREVSDEGVEGYSLIFKGNGVDDLRKKFEEETGLEGIIVCNKSPLNGKLYPLRLQLPPNNVTMHVVLVLPFSKVATELEAQGLL